MTRLRTWLTKDDWLWGWPLSAAIVLVGLIVSGLLWRAFILWIVG